MLHDTAGEFAFASPTKLMYCLAVESCTVHGALSPEKACYVAVATAHLTTLQTN